MRLTLRVIQCQLPFRPIPAPHSFLCATLVMLEGGAQSREHFGARFEKCLGFWLIDLVEVFAKMIDYFGEHPLNVARVDAWIAAGFGTCFHKSPFD
jgi:hypothetical protein